MNHFFKSSRQKRKVLVVDDEMVNRELLQAILSMNYDVSTATCGTEALEMLSAAEEPYSLILLDILMPQMNGFQVIEACKADESLKRIPIIVMTSEKSAEVRSIRMGADDFIAKPYRMPEVIIARCERIIELSEEKALIRSIEREPITGLYIKVFFDAYVRRLQGSIRGKMDAAVMRLDGLDSANLPEQEKNAIMKNVVDHFKDSLLGKKGMACRMDDNSFRSYFRHTEEFDAIIAQIYADIPELQANGIRLRVGLCSKVDNTESSDLWFERAEKACESLKNQPDKLTATYTE